MLNIVFAGTPPFAATIAKDLIESEHNVIAAFTQPDRPKGRGRQLQPSAVKTLALEHDIPVYQPTSLKTGDGPDTLKLLNPDIIVVVAYGLILPQAVLELPRYGCINVHASLLPRWRGAAPIQHAILRQDDETGITIMQMDAGLDTGDMLTMRPYKLKANDTLQSVEDALAPLGGEALLRVLNQIEEFEAEKQNDELATYASKITKSDALLHWGHSAKEIHAKVRAFNPRPIAHTLLDDQNIKIHEATVIDDVNGQPPGTILSATKDGIDVATESGTLRITCLQLPGKKALPVADVLNSKAEFFSVGKQFSE